MPSVIVLRDLSGDGELEIALKACGAGVRVVTSPAQVLAEIAHHRPDILVIEPGADHSFLEVARGVPGSIRMVAVGDWGTLEHASAADLDCVVLAPADEATLRGVLAPAPLVAAEGLVRELLGLSIFDAKLPESMQELAIRLARAFTADDCVVVLPEEGTCYLASMGASDELVDDLVSLASTVSKYPTAVLAPYRPGRPYRTFLGLSLTHSSAQPVATILLCRAEPVPFGRAARAYLRHLADRLRADLSWRLVHERLAHDRNKLRELSRIDPVMGVANRTALQEELARRMAEAERRSDPLSVAVVDVDGLRYINERCGYPGGDAVLEHIAQVARLETRTHDVVARYAGDSVAIVLPHANAEQASAVLTRILVGVDATPVVHEDQPIHLTVSAGIAEVRHEIDTGESALGRAMAARQRARVHGEVIGIASDSEVADVAQSDFQVGVTLGGVYQIRHEISSGAFGVVYRAEDLALGRQVALKLLRPDLARDTVLVDNFRSEAATLARIRHPNLVQVYAFGVDGENVYFAMELVEGQGLDQRIHSARKRKRHLPLTQLLGIVQQVADALEAVHRAGMVHRDVKPENVLVDRIHRRCVLVDVGIAVRRGGKSAAGTPGFTAPEVFGGAAGTPASDVYSLGALAYLLLTMQAPFGEDGTPLTTLELQRTQRPPLPTSLRRGLPSSVDDLLLSALDPDPARRPTSTAALASALNGALEQPGIKPRMTIETDAPAPPSRSIIVSGTSSSSLRAGPPSAPSTRGVLFRAACEALGARRGGAWIARLSRQTPELGKILALQSSSLSWRPTSSFVTVLQSLADDDAGRRALATQLGRSVADVSLRDFFGADPSAVSPAQILRTTDLLWRCYHSWGRVSVVANETAAEVTLTDGIASDLLCACTAGLLGGIITRAGGFGVDVRHETCTAATAQHCVFRLTWRMPAEAGQAPTIRSDS